MGMKSNEEANAKLEQAKVGTPEWLDATIERHLRIGEFLQIETSRDFDQLKGWGAELEKTSKEMKEVIAFVREKVNTKIVEVAVDGE